MPVHYRGATPALNDMMGGHTNMMMVSVSLALPTHRDGKVKMLGIGSAKRLPQLPEFPTIAGDRQPAGLQRRHLVRPGGDRRNAARRSSTRSTPRCAQVIAEPAFKERFLDAQFFEPMDQFAGGVRGLHQAPKCRTGRKVIREQNLEIGSTNVAAP